jgi:hypothetical protein
LRLAGSIAGKVHRAEVGLIGRDGLTDVSGLLGVSRSPYDTVVQIEVIAQSILLSDLRRATGKSKN